MIALPDCKHRGPQKENGLFPCESPLLTAPDEGVPELLCRVCPVADQAEARSATAPEPPPVVLLPEQIRETTPVSTLKLTIAKAPPGNWPGGWEHWSNVREAHRQLADDAVANATPYPKGRFSGRGILIAGGIECQPHRGLPNGYLPSAWVLINKLRHLGCKLPIQLWYLGPHEMDPYTCRLLAPFGVECVDARELEKQHPSRILAGWELKSYACMNSPFEEVMFLDADNTPLTDPASLFEHPEYRRAGAVFWPDYDCWRLHAGVWRVFGMEPRDEPAFESGQFMIDKRRCWRELQLAHHYAEHSDYTFCHVYGDKEVFHLAWRKLSTEYASPAQPPGWETHTIVQHDFDGKWLFLHRCQDKWRLDGGNNKTGLPDDDLHFGYIERLREVWPGRPWSNPHPSPEERAVLRDLTGRTFRYVRLPQEGFDGDQRPMQLMPGNRIGRGSAGCEIRWEVNDTPTGMTLSLCRHDRPTCILRREAGAWVGRWLDHERCAVRMEALDPPPSDSYRAALVADEVADLLQRGGWDVPALEVVRLADILVRQHS
jgi:hypothetical protein